MIMFFALSYVVMAFISGLSYYNVKEHSEAYVKATQTYCKTMFIITTVLALSYTMKVVW